MRLLHVITALTIVLIAVGAAWFFNAQKGAPPRALETQYMIEADRFLNVEGARVRIREEGAADAPALILIHGFTFSLESWDGWAEALSNEYRVIRFDLLGHGLTGPDPQERYTPDARAAFLGAILDALEIERASIAGNSLGGLVAWRFAAANPERVDKLILVNAPAYPFNGVADEPAPLNAALKAFFKLAPMEGVEKSASALFADPSIISEDRLIIMRDMMRREGNGDAFISHLEMFTMPDPDELLGRITTDTLVMWGRKDALITVEQAPKIQRAIPGADLIIYEDLGHVPHEEAPARTVKDARAFLAGVRS